MSTFAIIGATGKVGGRAARQLLASGFKVRSIVRNASSNASLELQKLGSELFEIKVTDVNPFATDLTLLTAAFTGVDGAFILIPPHLITADPNQDAFAYLETVKQAIIASKIKKVVFLSSIAAHQPSGVGVVDKLHHLEQEFNALVKVTDLAVVYVRPGFFFTNFMGPLAAVPHGILPGAVLDGNIKVNFVSGLDIGDQVAKSLADTSIKSGTSHVVELGGPEELSYAEVASIISDIVGKPVVYAPTPKADQQKTYEGLGFSPAGATQFIQIAEAVVSGKVAFEHPDQVVRGKIHLKDFLTSVLKK